VICVCVKQVIRASAESKLKRERESLKKETPLLACLLVELQAKDRLPTARQGAAHANRSITPLNYLMPSFWSRSSRASKSHSFFPDQQQQQQHPGEFPFALCLRLRLLHTSRFILIDPNKPLRCSSLSPAVAELLLHWHCTGTSPHWSPN
jgi:hypothetical protein